MSAVEREPFKVDSLSKATWAMRKLKEISDKILEAEQVAKEERERINNWLNDVCKPLANEATFFESQLIQYAKEQRELGNKTVSTPFGKVKSRAGQPRLDIDTESFIAWASENNRDDLLRYKEPEPDAKAIKEAISAGKQIIGVSVSKAEVQYSIEVAE